MKRLAGARVSLVALVLLLGGAWLTAALLLWQTTLPPGLNAPALDIERYVPEAVLDRATSYQSFARINQLTASAAQVAALGLFAVRGASYARESAAGRIGTGMLLGMLAMAFVWLARFPFSLAALWWHRRYDLTEVGYVDWAIGDFLSAGGAFLFISLALLVVMGFAGRWPRHGWIAATPALLAIAALAALTQPYLLPNLERLRDPEVAADARTVAETQGLPGPSVWVQETHGLTSVPNAGALGIGPSERVILWDNLLDGFDREEIRVVLGHELAHLSRGHIWKHLAWLALLAVPIGWIAARTARNHGGLGQPAAVPFAIFAVAGLLFATAPLRTAFSQRLEVEADWVALETTRDPDAAVRLMSGFVDRGLAAPDHPLWSSLLVESHPSVIERIELAEAWRTRNPE